MLRQGQTARKGGTDSHGSSGGDLEGFLDSRVAETNGQPGFSIYGEKDVSDFPMVMGVDGEEEALILR